MFLHDDDGLYYELDADEYEVCAFEDDFDVDDLED
jgi:hypothetical protein